MSIKILKDDNKIYCKLVAKSISNIIRFSLDEEFRRSSYELFGVSSTKEVEKEINKRLLLITENERKVLQNSDNKSKKKGKNLYHKKNKENQQEPKDSLDENETNPSVSTNKDESQTFPQSFFQQNELQTSSQRYRNVIKRRKLDYFSQPESIKSNQEDFEFSKGNLKCSHSQPSTTTSHTVYYEAVGSSSEISNNEINYCQKMFTDSFKNNAQKYLKKNLKSYRQINF